MLKSARFLKIVKKMVENSKFEYSYLLNEWSFFNFFIIFEFINVSLDSLGSASGNIEILTEQKQLFPLFGTSH